MRELAARLTVEGLDASGFSSSQPCCASCCAQGCGTADRAQGVIGLGLRLQRICQFTNKCRLLKCKRHHSTSTVCGSLCDWVETPSKYDYNSMGVAGPHKNSCSFSSSSLMMRPISSMLVSRTAVPIWSGVARAPFARLPPAGSSGSCCRLCWCTFCSSSDLHPTAALRAADLMRPGHMPALISSADSRFLLGSDCSVISGVLYLASRLIICVQRA